MRYVGRAMALHGVVPVGSGVGFGMLVQHYRERGSRKRVAENSEDTGTGPHGRPDNLDLKPPVPLDRRLYVLDTNVILHDSSCLWRFGRHDICLPITVLEELDKFKRGNEEIHFHAREFLRMLDEMTMVHCRQGAKRAVSAVTEQATDTEAPTVGIGSSTPDEMEHWSYGTASASALDWLVRGVPLSSDRAQHGSVRISLHCRDSRMERLFFYDSPDMRILAAVHALAVAESMDPPAWMPQPMEDSVQNARYSSSLDMDVTSPRYLYERVVLVTKDVNLRMKARAIGLHAEDYEQDRVESISKLYLGQRRIENVPNALVEALYSNPEGLSAEEFATLMGQTTQSTCGDSAKADMGFLSAENARSTISWIGQQILPKGLSGSRPDPANNGSARDALAEERVSSEDPRLVKPHPNEHFILRNANGSALATYAMSKSRGEFVWQRVDKVSAYGITPRNAEQSFALRVLLDPDIPLVTICGVAGTGKTLLCLAAALEMATRGYYEQIFVSRPIVPLGNRDVGFLPGDLDEKLAPYMQPLYDNLGVIKAAHMLTKDNGKVVPTARSREIDDMMASERIKIAALAYIRGRSLGRTFLIVDESQNLTPHEVKTIITRAGEGTKVVLCGDLHQIDNPYVDGHSNGLSYLIERMKGQCLYAHVTLEKGERSELSKLASELL
jgi:predicted ribonuclease YlaK